MENPEPFLHDLHGKVISVMLKWGWELRGILQSKDEYMNLLVPPSLRSSPTPKRS
jgi:small nuclear ribonucleoprotein (snRNP)-like protein